MTAAVDQEKLGEKYILSERIGTGGMADVYRARLVGERGFEKPIVIKKLLPQYLHDQEIIDQFINEARLAALLQHENIAATYDFGEADGQYFLAMEYLAGRDLAAIIRRAGSLGKTIRPPLALMIAARICDGMEYAHRLTDLEGNPLGLVHRDLTPQNIFITFEGRVKILDFGVARTALPDQRTRLGVVKGKVAYMPPEQLAGESIDQRADIFAVGILLYEMLSGKRMYSGDTATLIKKCLNVEYQPLGEAAPSIPVRIRAIVSKALAARPEDRFQTTAEMQAEIEDCLHAQAERPGTGQLKQYLAELFLSEQLADGNPSGKQRPDDAPRSGSRDDKEHGATAVLEAPAASLGNFGKRLIPAGGWWRGTLRPRPAAEKIFAVAAGILLAAGIGVLLVRWSNTDQGAADLASGGGNRQIPANQGVTPPLQKDRRAGDVSASLQDLEAQAERALAENRLLEPEDDNAIFYYREMLRADPENDNARQGIRRIGDRFAAKAEASLKGDRIPEARRLLVVGLAAAPEYARLQGLQKEVDQRASELIQELAREAERCIAEDRLTTPAEDSALRYYREIQLLEAESDLADAGLQRIADRYAALADQAFTELRIAASREYVRRGLEVWPSHSRLLALKRELNRPPPGIIFNSIRRSFERLF